MSTRFWNVVTAASFPPLSSLNEEREEKLCSVIVHKTFHDYNLMQNFHYGLSFPIRDVENL